MSDLASLNPAFSTEYSNAYPLESLELPLSRCRMGFILFICVNAVLFVRPADLLPALEVAPFYEILIVLAALASMSVLVQQLTVPALSARPLVLFVTALLPCILLSQLSHGAIYQARIGSIAFAKILVYFLLLTGLIDSTKRLKLFLLIIGAFILVVTILCILNWHGIIDLESLTPVPQWVNDDQTGEAGVIMRLNGPGIFNDPNDLSLSLATGILLSIHFAFDLSSRILRLIFLTVVFPFGYALSLTRSRGGLLALMAGLVVYCVCRMRKRWAIPLLALLLPAMLFAFAGRQTDIDLSNNDDTFMGRVMIWRDSLVLFHQSPIFGIGIDSLADEINVVAHNSYVHAFVELGFLGGTMFIGAISVAVVGLWRLRKRREELSSDDLKRLWPFMCAMLASYFVGLYSLSRVYSLPTYCILGIAGAYLSMAEAEISGIVSRLSAHFIMRTIVVGAAALVYLELFVRLVGG